MPTASFGGPVVGRLPNGPPLFSYGRGPGWASTLFGLSRFLGEYFWAFRHTLVYQGTRGGFSVAVILRHRFFWFFVPFSPLNQGSGPRRLRLYPSVFRGVRAMFRPPDTACYLSHYLGLSMVCRPWRHPPGILLRGLWRCASGLGWVVSMRVCRPVWLAGHAGVGHGWSLGIP